MAGRNRRWVHARRKADSNWEVDLGEGILKNYDFHNKNYDLKYSIPKTYQPDFVKVHHSGTMIYVESKGFFVDRSEMRKYIFIKEALDNMRSPEGGPCKLVILFWDSNYKVPGSKPRKDGTRLSYGEWATKQGIEWYDEDTFPEEYK